MLASSNGRKNSESIPFVEFCRDVGMAAIDENERRISFRDAQFLNDHAHRCARLQLAALDAEPTIAQRGKQLDRDALS